MSRKVFFSFHFDADAWRTSQVRHIGVVEGNAAVLDNAWEEVKAKSDKEIKEWIGNQLYGRTCTIVLIGERTSERRWVKYEIQESLKREMGLFGIYIDRLKDANGHQSCKGKNPFDNIRLDNGHTLSSYVPVYDPPYNDSQYAYGYIEEHVASWVEEAINNRINVKL